MFVSGLYAKRISRSVLQSKSQTQYLICLGQAKCASVISCQNFENIFVIDWDWINLEVLVWFCTTSRMMKVTCIIETLKIMYHIDILFPCKNIFFSKLKISSTFLNFLPHLCGTFGVLTFLILWCYLICNQRIKISNSLWYFNFTFSKSKINNMDWSRVHLWNSSWFVFIDLSAAAISKNRKCGSLSRYGDLGKVQAVSVNVVIVTALTYDEEQDEVWLVWSSTCFAV